MMSRRRRSVTIGLRERRPRLACYKSNPEEFVLGFRVDRVDRVYRV